MSVGGKAPPIERVEMFDVLAICEDCTAEWHDDFETREQAEGFGRELASVPSIIEVYVYEKRDDGIYYGTSLWFS